MSLLSAAPLKTAQLLVAGKEPVRIVCIGDSITGVYYHSGGMRAYPEMLQIALQKLHPKAKVTVRNAGGLQELVVEMGNGAFVYEIVW